MTTYLTSDTHFRHKNILNLGEGRPFDDLETHDEMIIKNWNEVVTPDDTVYHLGDVALGPWPEGLGCVKRLLGHKILIPGNHDRISSVESEKRRERFLPDYEDAFQEIWDEVATIQIAGHEALISHYPYAGESDPERPDRHMKLRPADNGGLLIHGHTHAQEKVSFSANGGLQISVGVDAWNFTPVSEDQIAELISEHL